MDREWHHSCSLFKYKNYTVGKPSIPACRQIGMLWMVEIERFSSLLRAGLKLRPF